MTFFTRRTPETVQAFKLERDDPVSGMEMVQWLAGLDISARLEFEYTRASCALKVTTCGPVVVIPQGFYVVVRDGSIEAVPADEFEKIYSPA